MAEQSAPNTTVGPLAGIRVVEIAGIGPTQFCGMLLADMGARILRLRRTPAMHVSHRDADSPTRPHARFPGRIGIVVLVNALMGLPPVVVGLFVCGGRAPPIPG